MIEQTYGKEVLIEALITGEASVKAVLNLDPRPNSDLFRQERIYVLDQILVSI